MVILTTSQAEEDILRSYGTHANCHITEPIDMLQFFKVIASIENFRFTVARLPNGVKDGGK